MFKLKLTNFRGFSSGPAELNFADNIIGIVGTNNSGKSTILRSFFELRSNYQLLSTSTNYPRINTDINLGISSDLFSRNNDGPIKIEVQSMYHQGGRTVPVGKNTATLAALTFPRDGSKAKLDLFNKNDERLSESSTDVEFDLIEQAFQTMGDSMYIGPFRNLLDYSSEPSRYFDLALGANFVGEFDELRRGSDSIRRRDVRALLVNLADKFSLDLRMDIQAAPNSRTLNIDLDGVGFNISEFGGGFTQFTILLVQIAMRKPTLLLVDEPELNLHPRLQVTLLELLQRYCQTLIFATHNLGLARTVALTRYITNRAGSVNTLKPALDYPRLPELLGEMNFSGLHELSNGVIGVICVEGQTDIPVIRHFLQLHNRADRYLLIALNGDANIRAKRVEELHELKRITSNVAIIIDSEKSSEGALLDTHRAEFVEACHQANITVHVLERRAIENYFSDSAVQLATKGQSHSLKPFEKFDKSVHWSKSKNGEIALLMTSEEVKELDVFEFLVAFDSTVVAS